MTYLPDLSHIRSEKRRAFIRAYCGEAKGNVTEAARMAGYKAPHPEGARLLQNPTISAAIELWREATRTKDAMDRIEALEILGKIARGDEEVGEPITDLSGAVVGFVPAKPRDRTGAIRQMSKMEGWEAAQRVEVSAAPLPKPELAQKMARALVDMVGRDEALRLVEVA